MEAYVGYLLFFLFVFMSIILLIYGSRKVNKNKKQDQEEVKKLEEYASRPENIGAYYAKLI